MYKKKYSGWLKHADFLILDIIVLQLSFLLHIASVMGSVICMRISCMPVWQSYYC